MINKSLEGTTGLELAHKACMEGLDFSNLIAEYFTQLSALFVAINKIEGTEHSTISQLSELGRYLCEDWASSANMCKESFEEHHEAFSTLLFPKRSPLN